MYNKLNIFICEFNTNNHIDTKTNNCIRKFTNDTDSLFFTKNTYYRLINNMYYGFLLKKS